MNIKADVVSLRCGRGAGNSDRGRGRILGRLSDGSTHTPAASRAPQTLGPKHSDTQCNICWRRLSRTLNRVFSDVCLSRQGTQNGPKPKPTTPQGRLKPVETVEADYKRCPSGRIPNS